MLSSVARILLKPNTETSKFKALKKQAFGYKLVKKDAKELKMARDLLR